MIRLKEICKSYNGREVLRGINLEIADRDYKDSHRSVSPLRPAEDSITFDTTGVSISDVVAFIEEKAKKILDK